jgi:hypothetical protein
MSIYFDNGRSCLLQTGLIFTFTTCFAFHLTIYNAQPLVLLCSPPEQETIPLKPSTSPSLRKKNYSHWQASD